MKHENVSSLVKTKDYGSGEIKKAPSPRPF